MSYTKLNPQTGVLIIKYSYKSTYYIIKILYLNKFKRIFKKSSHYIVSKALIPYSQRQRRSWIYPIGLIPISVFTGETGAGRDLLRRMGFAEVPSESGRTLPAWYASWLYANAEAGPKVSHVLWYMPILTWNFCLCWDNSENTHPHSLVHRLDRLALYLQIPMQCLWTNCFWKFITMLSR